MRKVQITFDCPDDETYLQVLGISKSFKEQLSGLAEVEVKEVESPASDDWVAVLCSEFFAAGGRKAQAGDNAISLPDLLDYYFKK